MWLLNIIRKATYISNGGQNLPWISRKVMAFLHSYDHLKYWNRRAVVVDANNKTNPLLKMYYLLWIKRIDSKHHCSFGTSFNSGSKYITSPFLPHAPHGIIVGQFGWASCRERVSALLFIDVDAVAVSLN